MSFNDGNDYDYFDANRLSLVSKTFIYSRIC